MEARHSLLERQLKKHLGNGFTPPPEWEPFIEAINRAYHDFDADRELVENSLELSSQELFAAHSEIRAVFQALPDLVLRLGPGGVILAFNAGEASDTLHLPLLGQPLQSVLTKEVGDQLPEALAQVTREKRTVSIEYVENSGKRAGFFELRLVPLLEDQIVAIIRNITERKTAEMECMRMEVQLRHAQKMESIGQLAAGIAHEINTPTQYIGDNTHFIQESFQDLSELLAAHARLLEAAKSGKITPELIAETEAAAETADIEYLLEEIPKAIEQSLQGVRRVSKIVGAMKDFSHPGTDEKTAVDLNRAIESTLTVTSNEWKYLAEMATDFAPNLPPVPCLPGEFNQVILNMIINASHAIEDVVGKTGKKGTITVSTRQEGESVEIRISDTGTGIPEEIRQKIYDPFFTTKGVGRGTGQGLAIAHSVVVDKHGGEIQLESELGQGSTFIIRMPLRSSIGKKSV